MSRSLMCSKYLAPTIGFLAVSLLSASSFAQTVPAKDAKKPAPKAAPSESSAPKSAEEVAPDAKPQEETTSPAEGEGEAESNAEGAGAASGGAAVGAEAGFEDSDAVPEASSETETAGEESAEAKDAESSKEEEEESQPKAEKKNKEEIKGNSLPFTYHQKHIDLQLGAQMIGANNDGLQPFSEGAIQTRGFVRGGGAFATMGPLAVALLGDVGWGSTFANVRGLTAQLKNLSLALGLEARYHFHHRFYAYGRVAPGAEAAFAQLGELSEVSLSDTSWAFSLDSNLGIAARLAGSSDGRKRAFRFWVFAEGGFRYAGKQKLSLEVDEGGPSRPDPLVLDPLSTTGALFAGGVGLSF